MYRRHSTIHIYSPTPYLLPNKEEIHKKTFEILFTLLSWTLGRRCGDILKNRKCPKTEIININYLIIYSQNIYI